jgi:hypothetical protein
MGTAVNQRAAMVVASPSFVVALANNLATMCLSGFGAMSSSWPQISDVAVARLKEELNESL